MTDITIFQDQNRKFLGFTCSGHSGYANAGEDIVCAGISVLVINTVNSLLAYTSEKVWTKSDEENGSICLQFASPAGSDAELLMKALVLGLQGIQETYGKEYLTLNFKEV
ncbi:MAG: ribosomal-processing cysteine protease Prp [Clostridiales bacterium]|nr:ribosomal-processing cysteine protease Prp [Clostridiales bacterium]